MRVLVGMSGGVDSAVTAYLLKQQGHEVVAGFMKNYANESNPNCHTREDRNMAIKCSQHLGIDTFIIFDFRKQYDEAIIQYIYSTYEQGLTPNPDILCNSEIKFKLFLHKGLELGFDAIATGHYAQVKEINGVYQLHKGVDTNKDQSYFLCGLNQKQLSHALFPLGHLTKPEVRTIAKEIDLPNAERKDSQGLCFIGKVDMKTFLEQTLPKTPGDITTTEGKKIGTHDGIQFYTVGQRKGLGLSGGPRYVISKDKETNTLLVSDKEQKELMSNSLIASNRHRTSQAITLPRSGTGIIRYRQTPQKCTITKKENNTLLVTFDKPQRAISPGQTVCIFKDEQIIGSGIIEENRKTI